MPPWRFPTSTSLLLAAAVADYAPAEALAGKRPKDDRGWTVELAPTVDIARTLGEQKRAGQVLVAFGAEHGAEGLERKRQMLETKNADLVVFNDVGRSDIGFDAADNEVTLVTRDGERPVPKARKDAIAAADPRRGREAPPVAPGAGAVVMAAGEGTRLRPLTERWPKPVLPIDGRPVVVTLVHELAAAGCTPIVVVTGHLAEQVEELLEPLPYDLRFVRQPPGSGSADAVNARPRPSRRTSSSAADTPLLAAAIWPVCGRRALRAATARIAVHGAFRPRRSGTSARRSARHLDPLPGRAPYELAACLPLAVDAGAQVSAIQVGRTRDLTTAVDLVRENFDYLR